MFKLIQFMIVIAISIAAMLGINTNANENTTINTTNIESLIETSLDDDDDISESVSVIDVESSIYIPSSEDVSTPNTSNSTTFPNSSSIISSITPTPSSPTLPKMNLLLISGHANKSIDPGAVSGNRYEYAYCLEFVNLLNQYIKQRYPYINVILEDAPYKADKEAEYILKVKPHYVINIHFNAGGGRGLEIITPLENRELLVATSIINMMKQENLPTRITPIYSRSTTNTKIARTVNNPLTGTNYYAVIQAGTRIGVLSEIIELEFIDNNAAMLAYEANINSYVRIVGQSIDKYYHQAFKK